VNHMSIFGSFNESLMCGGLHPPSKSASMKPIFLVLGFFMP